MQTYASLVVSCRSPETTHMNDKRLDAEPDLAFVLAKLTFLRKTGEKPVNYPSVAGGVAERNIGEADGHTVRVHNARCSDAAFSHDEQGFMLVPQTSAVSDFYADSEIEAIHHAEVTATIQIATGARQVVVFDVTRRSDDLQLMQARRTRDPARTVHSDYTERSARQRVKDLLPAQAEQCLARRFAIVNLWRSMAGPVLRAPVALCDARTLDEADLIPTERRARDRIGETYRVAYNPGQRWYYFPRLAPQEALLIKTFDSAPGRRAAPHAAFDDPSTGDSAPPRESIESRAFVFY